MTVSRYLLEVSTRALPGRDSEYDRWYDETHVGEVLAVPGFLSCERFRRVAADGEDTGEFVALYEVETNDPPALLQTLFAATPGMQLSDDLDRTTVRFEFLRPGGRGRVAAR